MLPIAVSVERTHIPDQVKASVNGLAGCRPLAFTGQMLLAWAVIISAIVAAEMLNSVWVSLLAVAVIATRQNLLALLTHEQVHLLGYRHRFGDLLVNLFCAWPLLVLTTEGYAQVHLAHHRDYFTQQDPDFLRKSGEEWRFPMPWRRLLRIVIRDITGMNVVALLKGKRSKVIEFKRPGYHPKFGRPIYYFAIMGLLAYAGMLHVFFLYWVLPIVTVLQLIIRWGAVCEHAYTVEGASVSETTPLIEPSWWQRLLLPNMNFTLHIYHHYFPGVAYSKLPEVHRLFKSAGLVNASAVFHGYGEYLRYLVSARYARTGEK